MQQTERLHRRAVEVGRALVAVIALGVILLPGMPTAAAPVVVAEVESAPCVTAVPGGARCGVLTVPVSRTAPESAKATLPYVIVPAALDTGKPPLVYLAGDTALSTLDVDALAVAGGLASDRDVVFLERRGGRDAQPSLVCEPADTAFRASLGAQGDRATRVAAVGAAFASCAAAWQQDGVIPSDFTVAPAAADLRDLRQQLGYDRWTILAVGSSAGVALIAPEIDPGGVDGVILDGPDLGAPGVVSAGGVASALAVIRERGDGPDRSEPEQSTPLASTTPEQAGADEATAQRAEAEPTALAQATTVLDAATAQLDTEPYRMHGPRPVTFGGDAVLALASTAVAEPNAQAALPALLEAVADGDRASLAPWTTAAVDDLTSPAAVQDRVLGCSTAGWPGAVERPGAEGTGTSLLEDVAVAACASLGVPASPPPVPSGGSLLVLSAPEQSATLTLPVADDAKRAIAAAFPGAGARPGTESACARVAVRAWLSDPTSYRAALCDADDAAVHVVRRGDVAASPRWTAQASSDPGGWWLVLALPVLFGLVSIGWSIAWAYRLIAQALRRQPVQDGLLLGIAPVFGATWAVGTAVVLVRAAAADPAIALLGVPAALPWLSVALLVGCLGLLPVWQGAHPGTRLRITVLSLLWAATAGWTALYLLAWW